MEDLNKTCTVKSAESHFMTAIIVVESTAEHYAVRPCSYIGLCKNGSHSPANMSHVGSDYEL